MTTYVIETGKDIRDQEQFAWLVQKGEITCTINFDKWNNLLVIDVNEGV